jgi:hypothetical protein
MEATNAPIPRHVRKPTLSRPISRLRREEFELDEPARSNSATTSSIGASDHSSPLVVERSSVIGRDLGLGRCVATSDRR